MRVKRHLENVHRKEVDIDKTQFKYRLGQSERTTEFPEEFWDGFLESIKQTDVIAYPHVRPLKEGIALINDVSLSNIFLTPGSDVAIRTMFDLSVTPGSQVVSTSPSFPMYKVYCDLYNAEFVGVEYDSNLQWSVQDMISKLNCTTKLVILANPNNPIGDVKTMDELLPLVKETSRLGIPLLIDEAYIEFNPQPLHSLIMTYSNVVICRTMSKGMGGAGVRLGYIIANYTMMKYIKKWRLMHEVTGIGVRFGLHLINNLDVAHDYILKTVAEREIMKHSLLFAGYDVVNSHANWLHFNDYLDNERATKIFDMYPHLEYRGGVTIPHDTRTNWIRLTVGPGMVGYPFIQYLLSSEVV